MYRLMSTYQCSVCFHICDSNLEVIEKFRGNKVRLIVFHSGAVNRKSLFHSPQFTPEFLVEWKAPINAPFRESPHKI